MNQARYIKFLLLASVLATGHKAADASTTLGEVRDGKPSLLFNEQTQQFGIDPDGADLGAVSIVSASGLLTGDDVIFPTEATLVEDLDNSVAFFLFPNNLLSDPFSLGRIAGERVSFDFLLSDLSLRFSPGLGIPNISSDLARGLIVGDRVVVPEPSSLLLVALAFVSVAAGQRRKG